MREFKYLLNEKEFEKMKKTYMTPAVEVNETLVSSMMALSLNVVEGTDGDEGEVKAAKNDWDMWGED